MELFATWTGPDFLAFYAVMLVTCVGLSVWIVANLRTEGQKRAVEDPERLAVLNGGAARFTQVILADLLAKGAIAPSDKTRVTVTRTSVEVGEAGAAILRKVGAFTVAEAALTLKSQSERIAHGLIRDGLLLDPGERTKLKAMAVAPFAALLLLGLYRQQAGASLGEPTGYLIGLMGLTLVCAVVRLVTIGTLTRAGQEVLQDWTRRSSRLRRAPEANELKWAVGLFGTGVLVGTPYAHVHAMRQPGSGGDGGGSDGGGSDGGGGEGGGCGGGCGGCGG